MKAIYHSAKNFDQTNFSNRKFRLLKWCKIQLLLLNVFSLKLFIFSLILFVFSHILRIFSLILFVFSQILYIFSIILFIFSHILQIFSLILFVFSHVLYIHIQYLIYIYSISSHFIQSSFLYSVSHTLREDIVPHILPCSRFRNNQTELRKCQIQKCRK